MPSMQTIVHVIILWFAYGFGAMILTGLVEMTKLMSDPDYYAWYKALPPSKRKRKGNFLVFWFTTWPLVTAMLIRAITKGQTLMQFVAEKADQAKAEKSKQEKESANAKEKIIADVDKKLADLKTAIETCPVQWDVATTDTCESHLLKRNLAEGVSMITHDFIVPTDKSLPIMCIRITRKGDPIPFLALPNDPMFLGVATQACIGDLAWAASCHPSMWQYQDIVWDELKKQIPKEMR